MGWEPLLYTITSVANITEIVKSVLTAVWSFHIICYDLQICLFSDFPNPTAERATLQYLIGNYTLNLFYKGHLYKGQTGD